VGNEKRGIPRRWSVQGDVHSAVSGRPIALAVEHRGDGRDTAYVTDEPRLYHLVIESSDVDWTVVVQEAVTGAVQNSR